MCSLLQFCSLGYMMPLICLQCSPTTISWVPHEWPGPMWRLRAWISGKKGPRLSKKLRPCALHNLPPTLVNIFCCLGPRYVRCFARNPSLRFPSVSGSWMFSWCPSCPFELFPVSIVSMCKSPCHPTLPFPPPHFRAAHSECPLLSLFGCIALCNSVDLPLSGLFFFLDSCRLFIVVPKACRCGVKYIVQIPVSSASLMLELSPLTLC